MYGKKPGIIVDSLSTKFIHSGPIGLIHSRTTILDFKTCIEKRPQKMVFVLFFHVYFTQAKLIFETGQRYIVRTIDPTATSTATSATSSWPSPPPPRTRWTQRRAGS